MLNFSKMHSLGNDFMVIDGVTTSVELDPQQIALWGNRQRGIGFDQLLLVEPPSSPVCDFDYVIFNADGSEAEQCGNGTRCVTDFVHRVGLTPTKPAELALQGRHRAYGEATRWQY